MPITKKNALKIELLKIHVYHMDAAKHFLAIASDKPTKEEFQNWWRSVKHIYKNSTDPDIIWLYASSLPVAG